MKRQIVIDLYAHTSQAEIDEILETLRGVGLDARLVEQVSATPPSEKPRSQKVTS